MVARLRLEVSRGDTHDASKSVLFVHLHIRSISMGYWGHIRVNTRNGRDN